MRSVAVRGRQKGGRPRKEGPVSDRTERRRGAKKRKGDDELVPILGDRLELMRELREVSWEELAERVRARAGWGTIPTSRISRLFYGNPGQVRQPRCRRGLRRA